MLRRVGAGEVGIGLFTLAAWGMLAVVVITLPVTVSSETLFYLCGGGALMGTIALLLWARDARSRSASEPVSAMQRLGTGFRLAIGLEFGLWLQSVRALNLVVVGLLLAGFVCLELIFRSAAAQRGERRRV